MRFTCDLCAPSAHIISPSSVKNGMPHLMAPTASGAGRSTSARSASRTARSSAGWRAKKPSMGAPRSARQPHFAAGVATSFAFAAAFGFAAAFFAVFMRA